MRVMWILGVALAACSGSGVTGTAPAQGIVAGSFDTADNTTCSAAGKTSGVGAFVTNKPISVLDKSTSERGVNHVQCRVADLGNEHFEVSGSFSLDDQLLFAIDGNFPASADAKGFKAAKVTLGNGEAGNDYAAFTQADGACTVLYTTSKQGAARGRVWGVVTCPNAVPATPNGGSAAGSCITLTEFRFENCIIEK
jgi:hypothetical protein